MTNARYVDRFSIVSLGGRSVGRRFNVSMVSLPRREEGEGESEATGRPPAPRQTEMDRPPTRDKFPQFYINPPSSFASRAHETSNSRHPPARGTGGLSSG